MRKRIWIVVLVAVAGILSVGCLTNDTNVNTSLNGYWSGRGMTINISDSNGVFTQINPPNVYWQEALDNGLINVGDQRLRNITQTGSLRWTAQEWGFIVSNNRVTGMDWYNITITMATNGRTITTRLGGTDMEVTYTRM